MWALSLAQSSIFNGMNTSSSCFATSFLQNYTNQQFFKINSCSNDTNNFTFIFTQGKHYLDKSIELNNTATVVIKGELDGETRPEITCKGKRCFSFRNSTSIHIENLVFTNHFSEDSYGGVIFISKAKMVNITQCLFRNNSIQGHGAAMRLQLIESVHVLKSLFIHNSAILSQVIRDCTLSNCTTSCGAISSTNISYFEIADSHFEGNTAYDCGGAISVSLSTVYIHRSRFIGGLVLGIGGSLWTDTSTVQLSYTVFRRNRALYGGGIFSTTSSVNIEHCLFESNLATAGGGAGYFYNSELNIRSNNFSNNSGYIYGAMVIKSEVRNIAIISDSAFLNNTSSILGGAISLQLIGNLNCTLSACKTREAPSERESSAVYITGCVFKLNWAHISGGAIYMLYGVVYVRDSQFNGNRGFSGGAVYSIFTFIHSEVNTFFSNEALLGGALSVNNLTLYSSQNNFTRNNASSGGGAIKALNVILISKNDNFTANNVNVRNGGAVLAYISVVVITHCIFKSNNCHSKGGAIFVYQGTFNSTKVLYNGNYANELGNALFFTEAFVSIHECLFYNNTRNISMIPDQRTFSEYLDIRNEHLYTVYLINVRGICTNLTFINNLGSLCLFESKLRFLGSITFSYNNGVIGGAITLIQSTAVFEEHSQVTVKSNTAHYGGGIFLSQSDLEVLTASLQIVTNIAGVSGGGIFGYQSRVTVNLKNTLDLIRLTNNSAKQNGGAFTAIATDLLIIFQGFVLFYSNEAQRGGAINLSKGSKIKILKTAEESVNHMRIKLTFSNNIAEYGGAIYVADSTNTGVICKQSNRNVISTEECFIQTLRLYFPRNEFKKFNYMNIFFSSNKGHVLGSDIYGGLLDRCQLNSFSEIYNLVSVYERIGGFDYLKISAQFQIGIVYTNLLNPNSLQFLIRNITRDDVIDLISSDPVQICFCVNDTYNCSYLWPTVLVKRGETFTVRAVTVD